MTRTGNIVTDSGFSQGTAWADFNNDGFEDLFVTNSWTNGNNFLLRNNGDGTFTKITDQIPANDGGNSNGCTWGDVDNDGDVDLFVANVNDQNNFLYINNGGGNFSKIINSPASTDGGWSYTGNWADFNNDGWLDLFVGNYKEQINFLYLNEGNGTLKRIFIDPITTDQKSTQGCAWFDYDNDGDLDLYVANLGVNDFYRNDGNLKFTKITDIEPAKHQDNSFGCSTGDYDNDGYIDIFVANWWGKNALYRNLGNGSFEKIKGKTITEESLNSEGSSWGDFDNDGDLDLIVTNDGDNSVFENRNNEFIKLTDLIVANDSSNSNGVTWNDFDNDGDLDLFIANGGNQPNLLYTNPGNNNSWIKFKCIGTKSNKSAIGARLVLYQNDKIQTREVSGQTGGGYGGQNGLIVHFGLGQNRKVDSLNVYWPSGKVTMIKNPKANKLHVITEE